MENVKARGIDLKARLGTEDPKAIAATVKGRLVDHMAEGAAIAAVLEENEVLKVRIACGATPSKPRSSGNDQVRLHVRFARGGKRGTKTCVQPDPCVPNREPRRKRCGFIQGGLANLTEFLDAAKIAVTFRGDPAGEPRAQIDGKVS